MTEAQVEKRIEEIKQEKARQLAELDAKIKDCESVINGIDAKIEAAAAKEDLEGWNKATFEKQTAAAKSKMLQQKRKQVNALDFVKPEETNSIIDGIIDRQIELDALLSAAIIEADEKINNIFKTYKEEINTDAVIKTWIREIHPYSGKKYASRFEMRTGYNAAAGREITRQEYENGRYAESWETAAFIARDFTERVTDDRDELLQAIALQEKAQQDAQDSSGKAKGTSMAAQSKK